MGGVRWQQQILPPSSGRGWDSWENNENENEKSKMTVKTTSTVRSAQQVNLLQLYRNTVKI
jgi:hypothetical protein